MTEKYYSVVIPNLQYTVTGEYIDRNHQNFIIVCGFTSDYYEYIKKRVFNFISEGYVNRGYGARKPHQVSWSSSKATKWVLRCSGETCSSRIGNSPIIKVDLRERMLPHGEENFEKK